jgi:hypothetical protein
MATGCGGHRAPDASLRGAPIPVRTVSATFADHGVPLYVVIHVTGQTILEPDRMPATEEVEVSVFASVRRAELFAIGVTRSRHPPFVSARGRAGLYVVRNLYVVVGAGAGERLRRSVAAAMRALNGGG